MGSNSFITTIVGALNMQVVQRKANVPGKEIRANPATRKRVEVPESFARDKIMRLWYLSRCGPDGSFVSEEFPGYRRYGCGGDKTKLPLVRRIQLAAQMVILVVPTYAHMLWKIVRWRLVAHIFYGILVGLVPVYGTFARGNLVDAVQRSLHSKDVSAGEIVHLTAWSIVGSNAGSLIRLIMNDNARHFLRSIKREGDRVNLKLSLDIDMASSSNPIVKTLLQDCSSFGSSGLSLGSAFGSLTPGSDIPHIGNIVSLLSATVALLSSGLLAFATLKPFFTFDSRSALFVFMAAFPILFSSGFGKSMAIPRYDDKLTREKRIEKRASVFYSLGDYHRREVVLLGLRDWILQKWTELKAEADKCRDPQDSILASAFHQSGIPQDVITDVLYLCLGTRIFSESITLGSLGVIQGALWTVQYRMLGLSEGIDELIESISCISALIAAQAWIEERAKGEGRVTAYQPKEPGIGEKRGMKIEARGLSFRYPSGDADVLKDINFTVEPGQTLAIVGFNGGGKSTLANVLTGLYDYQGSLLIDGVEARTYQSDSLHRYMTVCPQGFAIFPLSIRDNIGLGLVEEIDNESAIMEAVKRGGAEEFIKASDLDSFPCYGLGLPSPADSDSGSETEESKHDKDENDKEQSSNGSGVTKASDGKFKTTKAARNAKPPKGAKEVFKEEKSIAFSGGQQQRLAISRAFMRADRANLLVLDEPSASLDARAEHELFQGLHALSRGSGSDTKTTIYISHRFSTVRRADKIAVMEGGTITEMGSHKELMELNGRYAEFFNLQVQGFLEE